MSKTKGRVIKRDEGKAGSCPALRLREYRRTAAGKPIDQVVSYRFTINVEARLGAKSSYEDADSALDATYCVLKPSMENWVKVFNDSQRAGGKRAKVYLTLAACTYCSTDLGVP